MKHKPTLIKTCFLAALLAWLLVGLGRPAPAQAHAALDRADPAPNSVLADHIHLITLWFTEPLEPDFSEIRVYTIEGERVDNADSRVSPDDPHVMTVTLPTLPDGTYTIAWKNVSTVDGHSLSGSYIYSVGQPLASAETAAGEEIPLLNTPLEPLVRSLLLWGLLTVTGGLAFERFITRPLAKSNKDNEINETLATRVTTITWIALVIAALAAFAQLLLQAAALFDIPVGQVFGGPLRSALSRTDWGQAWVWRAWLLLLLIVLYAVLTALRTQPSRQTRKILPVVQVITLLNAFAVLFTLSLVSHAAAMEELRAPAVFSDFIHLIASSFWVGGLVHLAVGFPLMLSLEGKIRRDWLSRLIPRFSAQAILSVGVLVITGLYSTWAQVTNPLAFATPYGLTLLAKVTLLVPLIILGAINLLRLSPRLAKEDSASTQMRRSVTLEVIIALLILAAVGLLISLEPARQVASREGIGLADTLNYTDTVEGTNINLTIEPALAGYNQAIVNLTTPQGRPITNADQVNLRFTHPALNLGSIETLATAGENPGDYVAEDVLLSVGGEWQVEVLIQRSDAFDAQTAFRFPLVASSGSHITPAVTTGQLLWGVEMLLLGLLFMGVATFLRGRRYPEHRAIAAPGMLALAAGIFLLANSQFGFVETNDNSRNPFPPDAESIAEGQHLYDENCVPCHGPTGRGDGPLAAELDPPPADLTMHTIHNPDEYLFDTIYNGKPDTAMPAFGNRLGRDNVWHLINYLRSLPPAS